VIGDFFQGARKDGRIDESDEGKDDDKDGRFD
jgi:hypothetical protein